MNPGANNRVPEQSRVVIIGAGPAGIGTAIGLARQGIEPVLLIDRQPVAGGVPAKYLPKSGGVPTFVVYTRAKTIFGRQYAEDLLATLAGTPTCLCLESQVIGVDTGKMTLTVVNPQQGRLEVKTDAIVFACGAREMTRAERGWIVGSRPARVFYTMQVIEWMDRHGRLPARSPAILGSDVIAYSIAAKLRAAGAPGPFLIDNVPRPRCGLPGRLYFRRWVHPKRLNVAAVRLLGDHVVKAVHPAAGTAASSDAVIVSGQLVPNSELIIEAGLPMKMPDQLPVFGRGHQLSTTSCFVAGNVIGDSHGAEWCHFNGRLVARAVARHLAAVGPKCDS